MANASSRIPRMFVSHSHHDDGFCHPLVKRIRTALGIADADTIFYDVDSLHPGDDFLPRLQTEVVSRPVFVVILTPHSVAANYVKYETNLALRLTIEHPERRLIPVLAEECDPNMLAPLLMGYQMVDFAHADYEEALSRLVTVLGSLGNSLDTSKSLSLFHASPHAQQALQVATQAHTAAEASDWDEAILQGEFATSFAENQSDANLWADLASAYIHREKWTLASEAARRSLDLDPFRGDVWSALADSLTAQGDLDDALVAIDRARAITLPTQPELRQALLKQRRYLLIRMQRWDAALDNIRQELVAKPDDYVAVATRDQILRRLGLTGAIIEHENLDSGPVQRLPRLVASWQWPTIDFRSIEVSAIESDPVSHGVIFDTHRRIKQGMERFGSLMDKN